jgi:predicted signal transduction protein with EAL and GGDEF domain
MCNVISVVLEHVVLCGRVGTIDALERLLNERALAKCKVLSENLCVSAEASCRQVSAHPACELESQSGPQKY